MLLPNPRQYSTVQHRSPSPAFPASSDHQQTEYRKSKGRRAPFFFVRSFRSRKQKLNWDFIFFGVFGFDKTRHDTKELKPPCQRKQYNTVQYWTMHASVHRAWHHRRRWLACLDGLDPPVCPALHPLSFPHPHTPTPHCTRLYSNARQAVQFQSLDWWWSGVVWCSSAWPGHAKLCQSCSTARTHACVCELHACQSGWLAVWLSQAVKAYLRHCLPVSLSSQFSLRPWPFHFILFLFSGRMVGTHTPYSIPYHFRVPHRIDVTSLWNPHLPTPPT